MKTRRDQPSQESSCLIQSHTVAVALHFQRLSLLRGVNKHGDETKLESFNLKDFSTGSCDFT